MPVLTDSQKMMLFVLYKEMTDKSLINSDDNNRVLTNNYGCDYYANYKDKATLVELELATFINPFTANGLRCDFNNLNITNNGLNYVTKNYASFFDLAKKIGIV